MHRWLLSLCLMLVGSYSAHGAACCGGGQGASLVISGEELTRARVSQAYSQIYGRSIEFGEAVFADNSDSQWRTTMSLVHVLSEAWQVGAEAGLSQTRSGTTRPRDLLTAATYTLHRNYLYSPILPEVFLSFGVVWPSGTSFYRDRQLATDDELYKAKASLVAIRSFREWDWSVGVHHTHSFAGHFSGVTFVKGAQWSTDWQIGVSPSFAPKFHLSLIQSAEYRASNQITVFNQAPQRSLVSYDFPMVLAISYALSEQWASSVSYSNQRLFRSQNSEISDGIGMQVSFRML